LRLGAAELDEARHVGCGVVTTLGARDRLGHSASYSMNALCKSQINKAS
jgi:hypothetical protein